MHVLTPKQVVEAPSFNNTHDPQIQALTDTKAAHATLLMQDERVAFLCKGTPCSDPSPPPPPEPEAGCEVAFPGCRPKPAEATVLLRAFKSTVQDFNDINVISIRFRGQGFAFRGSTGGHSSLVAICMLLPSESAIITARFQAQM